MTCPSRLIQHIQSVDAIGVALAESIETHISSALGQVERYRKYNLTLSLLSRHAGTNI